MENTIENCVFADKGVAEAKLNKFKSSGKEKIYLVSDFDRTITPFFNEDGVEISTWGLLSRKLPADIRNAEIELYKKYRPLEVAGKMTIADAIEWWSINLDYYEKSQLRWSDLALEVEEAIPARSGAKELFDLCKEKEMPAVIISAGIKDVIQLWCRKFNVRPEMIISTKLHFDAQGYIAGWDKNSLVHTLNKNEIGRKYLGPIQETRPYAILVGDSMDDAAMVDGIDNVLRFFIDDQQNKKARGGDFYDKVFEKFDLIVQNGSLMPIVKTIRSISV